MEDIAVETDLQTQEILLAASNHDVRALRDLLRNSSANVQDPETGITPLHAAILACEPEEKPEHRMAILQARKHSLMAKQSQLSL